VWGAAGGQRERGSAERGRVHRRNGPAAVLTKQQNWGAKPPPEQKKKRGEKKRGGGGRNKGGRGGGVCAFPTFPPPQHVLDDTNGQPDVIGPHVVARWRHTKLCRRSVVSRPITAGFERRAPARRHGVNIRARVRANSALVGVAAGYGLGEARVGRLAVSHLRRTGALELDNTVASLAGRATWCSVGCIGGPSRFAATRRGRRERGGRDARAGWPGRMRRPTRWRRPRASGGRRCLRSDCAVAS